MQIQAEAINFFTLEIVFPFGTIFLSWADVNAARHLASELSQIFCCILSLSQNFKILKCGEKFRAISFDYLNANQGSHLFVNFQLLKSHSHGRF